MANLSVLIIYEDKKFKIKIFEKTTAFVIFVPLGKTFQLISYLIYYANETSQE